MAAQLCHVPAVWSWVPQSTSLGLFSDVKSRLPAVPPLWRKVHERLTETMPMGGQLQGLVLMTPVVVLHLMQCGLRPRTGRCILCRALRGSSMALPGRAWQRAGAHVARGGWKAGVEGTEWA